MEIMCLSHFFGIQIVCTLIQLYVFSAADEQNEAGAR